MSYNLNIDWKGDLEQVSALDIHLMPVIKHSPGQELNFTQTGQRLTCANLNPGNYLLAFRYCFQGTFFDSFYFDLDIPDTTQIQIQLSEQGSQILEMGFLNDCGDFVDMLIYEDEKPFLTRSVESHVLRQTLSEFLVFKIHELPPQTAKKQLSLLMGDLSQSFPELKNLWPYQLKTLLQPEILAQTSAEWKAGLLHVLRNNLILMDNENLFNNLQEAIDLAQQTQKVKKLLDDLEWDYDTLSWKNYDAFLAHLKSQNVLIKS